MNEDLIFNIGYSLIIRFLPLFFAFALGQYFSGTAVRIINISFFILFIMSYLNSLFILKDKGLSLFDRSTSLRSFTYNSLINYTLIPLIFLLISFFLIKSESLRYGLLVALMMPVALVVPAISFSKKLNMTTSYQYLYFSIIIGPFLLISYSHNFFENHSTIAPLPLILTPLATLGIPIILVLLTGKFFPKLSGRIQPSVPAMNIVLLSILFFIFSGNIKDKLVLVHLDKIDLVFSFILVCINDFFVYFVIKKSRFLENCESTAFSCSLKNVALGGAILLFYDPVATIVPVLNIIPHIFMISYHLKRA